jgi:hypothetical protein
MQATMGEVIVEGNEVIESPAVDDVPDEAPEAVDEAPAAEDSVPEAPADETTDA